MTSKTNNKRHLILDTTKQIILEKGLHSLTLHEVAENASISKGGLLYHFPSKNALVAGLAQHIFDNYTEQFYAYANEDTQESGKWTRALIHASRYDLERNGELNAAILASSYLDKEASEQIFNDYNHILKKLDDDQIDPITTTTIRLAIDGIYYSQMWNIGSLTEGKISEILQSLLHMTESEDRL